MKERLTDSELGKLLAGLEGDEDTFLHEIGDAGDIGEEFYRALLEIRDRRLQESQQEYEE